MNESTKKLINEYLDMLDKKEYRNIHRTISTEEGRTNLVKFIYNKLTSIPNADIEKIVYDIDISSDLI